MLLAALFLGVACTAGPDEKNESSAGQTGDSGSPAPDTSQGDTGEDSAPADSAPEDTAPKDPVDDCVEEDSGVAVLMAFGSWSVPGGSFEAADIGYGAYGICSGIYLCDLRVDYTAVGGGQENCPDCEWSFEVSPSPRPTGGEYCDRLNPWDDGGGLFEVYTPADMWFGDGRLDGLGTNPAYQYVPDDGGTSYFLGQTFFIHYTYGTYDGWYFMAWNFPDYGYYQVYGNSEAASFARPIIMNGHRLYYYYY